MLKHHLFYAIICIFFTFADNSPTFAQTKSSDTVMLILGSANPKILHQRVNVAVRLYNSKIKFDRIIVSGGCGAHSSSICEASRMDSLLALNGVPKNKIFKEEKSKTTKQNYCYSKDLKYHGHKLINPDDHLYVVSSHWHAIPVAACFRAAGIKDAKYHIEGDINPYGPADYTHIFKDCCQPNYCEAILWPQVDAAYFNPVTNKIYYFVDNIYYRVTPNQGVDAGYPKKINHYPDWPRRWDEHVDAAWYNSRNHHVYLINGTEIVGISPKDTLKKATPEQTSHYFHHWPKSWNAETIDAAFYNPVKNELALFKNAAFLRISKQKIEAGFPKKIKKSYSIALPFQWDSGNLDAAWYRSKTRTTTLYRGTDYLQYNSRNASISQKYPKHTPLPWPSEIWGAKPRTN
jgi:hypothetical protein